MVVKVNRVPGDAGRYFRYLEAEARYADAGFGYRLYGTAARRTGALGRPVTIDELKRLAAGRSPDGRSRLGRGHRHRRWGFELVMHVPSRVGKAGEVLDDRQYRLFMTAVEKAAHDATAYLERHAAVTRVTRDGVKRREPVGLVYTVAVHPTNRNGEFSPHAHIVGFTRGLTANGRWAAVENRHLYDAQRAAKRVFNQALAYHLTRDVGLKVVPHRESIRVPGVDREWAKTARREEVKAETRRERQRTRAKAASSTTRRSRAKAATRAALRTRKPKDHSTSFAEVRQKWRQAAHATGRYAADLGRRAWTACTDAVQQARANRCYALGAKYCSGNVTRFPAAKVDEAAAFFATGRNVPPDRLAAAAARFHARPERYGLSVAESKLGRPEYTSAGRVSREQKLFAELAKLEARKRCGLSDRKVASHLCGGSATLSDLLAVRQIGAKRGVVAGASHAATDRGLKLAVDTYRREGRPVLAVGRTPQSTTRLNRALDVEAHSAGRLAEQLRPPGHWRCLKAGWAGGKWNPHRMAEVAQRVRRSALKLPDGCVVVTDLGRAEAPELRAVVKAVRKAKGKLVFTGAASADVRAGLDAHTRQHQQTADAGRAKPSAHHTRGYRR